MNTGMKTSSLAWLSALSLASCASAPQLSGITAPGTSADASAGTPGSAGTDAATSSGLGPMLDALGGLGTVAGKALETAGLKPLTPEGHATPGQAWPERRIRWALHASNALNVTANGQSLALVARIYRLRQVDGFLRAQFDAFGDPVHERQVLGDDLLSVREVQLLPGQRHESTDKVARDVPYLGIVALYHQPASGHWRYAFEADQAEFTLLTLGAHACALTVQSGAPIGQSRASARTAAVPCP
ncbi:MAG: type VI secretion system lipoprotein TssJ [Proteobacteria bacterium]|nr:type VI secretion system lipoprotein TssJ [Pseudomonadota bacterium]